MRSGASRPIASTSGMAEPKPSSVQTTLRASRAVAGTPSASSAATVNSTVRSSPARHHLVPQPPWIRLGRAARGRHQSRHRVQNPIDSLGGRRPQRSLADQLRQRIMMSAAELLHHGFAIGRVPVVVRS